MKIDIRSITESGLLIAMAAVLYLLSPGQLPYGGKISLHMLPLFLLTFRRGPNAGIIAGGIFGVIVLLLDPWFVHPVQIIMDYPLPYMCVGCAGYFSANIRLGIIIGGVGGFASHFLSGIIFFSAFAPEGMPIWEYSLLYNASYILQVILSVLLIPTILKKLARIA
ncbi:MAG: energy-coupled thiamine transporter ThiT [FCB group bacterium]|nr:energy-coupled thiamine transporter ThiT [FCB group bacterium]